MRFYVVGEFGRVEERVWCDNPDCPYYSGRGGIPVEQKAVIPRDGKDYCSVDCAKQAPLSEARYAR